MSRPRRTSGRVLVAAVAAAALAPLLVLLWVGWRLIEQDRTLAGQQVTQRIERAADIVAASIERAVSASEQRLTAEAEDWPEGCAVVRFTGNSVEANPPGRLAWLPAPIPLEEASPTVFAQGEEFEFRRDDLKSAALVYRELTKSSNAAVRAGAGVRLARVLRREGQLEAAVEAYREMEELEGAAIDRVPASLVALYASAELFTEFGRTADAERQRERLAEGLRTGRWAVTKAVYHLYGTKVDPAQEALSSAAEQLWENWRQNRPPANGRATVHALGKPVAVLWRLSDGGIRMLLATRGFVESEWAPAARAVADEQQVRFTLLDGNGAAVYGPDAAFLSPTARLSADEASLPWSIAVASADPDTELAHLVTRQRWFAAGFGMLVTLTLAAALFTIRTFRRELALSRLQSDFVAAVSHEFRTPLTSLRQFTDMLLEGRAVTEERKLLCYEAQSRSTLRLTRLVESLLDFGRLQGGTHPYRLEPCDGEDLVRQVVQEFGGEVEPAGYRVEFTGHGPAPIEADTEALTRALWNLLDNAVKYSPDHRNIEVGIERANGQVAISVSDRGLGIPAGEREAIFTRFRRGDQARRLGIKGTGIGLAMVDQIVKAHQGRMEVESEPGAGSRFTILLPAKD